MNEEDDLFKQEELVNIRLPRKEYEILKSIIEEREAYNMVTNRFKNSWIWVVGGGVLTIWLLYDKVILGVFK